MEMPFWHDPVWFYVALAISIILRYYKCFVTTSTMNRTPRPAHVYVVEAEAFVRSLEHLERLLSAELKLSIAGWRRARPGLHNGNIQMENLI